MKKRIFIIFTVIVALVIVYNASYTLNQNEAAIIFRMNKIQSIEQNAGFHFRIPFIDSVLVLYMGDNLYDIPVSDVITADKKSMIADNYVTWKITNPSVYYQKLGAVKARAEERIEAAVYNATKNTISSMTQDEIVAARGNTLTNMITEASNKDMENKYGLIIELAEIKALDLPIDNKNAVYERMKSERDNIAAGYKAKGAAEAKKIMNETDAKTEVMKAEAKRESTKLIAEGEKEYMNILSKAYNNPEKAEFYSFMRGLDALDAFKGGNKTLILDKNSEYARLLYGNN